MLPIERLIWIYPSESRDWTETINLQRKGFKLGARRTPLFLLISFAVCETNIRPIPKLVTGLTGCANSVLTARGEWMSSGRSGRDESRTQWTTGYGSPRLYDIVSLILGLGRRSSPAVPAVVPRHEY